MQLLLEDHDREHTQCFLLEGLVLVQDPSLLGVQLLQHHRIQSHKPECHHHQMWRASDHIVHPHRWLLAFALYQMPEIILKRISEPSCL
uniref:Uncharacterized protein n=1 Tax=Rhizophora mucronata TaxID=61149 RepID=A0A2P2KQJ3_RHIMU